MCLCRISMDGNVCGNIITTPWHGRYPDDSDGSGNRRKRWWRRLWFGIIIHHNITCELFWRGVHVLSVLAYHIIRLLNVSKWKHIFIYLVRSLAAGPSRIVCLARTPITTLPPPSCTVAVAISHIFCSPLIPVSQFMLLGCVLCTTCVLCTVFLCPTHTGARARARVSSALAYTYLCILFVTFIYL